MARKTQVILVDDVDGSAGTTTVEFGLDGITYEIDLNDDNAARLRADLGAWIEKGRRTGGRARRGTATSTSSETKRIREWAREQGYEISDRGRVSAEIRAAYAESH